MNRFGRFFSVSILLLTAAGLSNAHEASPKRATKHAEYRLIDLGTLGGPVSYGSPNGEGNQVLNDAGVVAASADTAIPDPNAPDFCFNFHPDGCFVTHAVRWKQGILTDLGALSGLNGSMAGAINGRGWSVGYAQNGLFDPNIGVPVTTAVMWKGEQIHDLGTLGGIWGLATSITNEGQVFGMSTVDNSLDPFAVIASNFVGVPFPSPTHPFTWKRGAMTDLGTLGGPDAFVASACVNQGLAVGSSFTSATPELDTGIPPLHPFASDGGTMIDLGTLGGTIASAQCGNNRGQVIGLSFLAGNMTVHPFLWERGVLKDLGTLGGDNGFPIWINDAGEVVGEADVTGNQTSHAFLWRKGVMTDLGSLDSFSHAEAINSKTQVVGYYGLSGRTAPPFRHAFLWEDGGPMVDLNTLIPASSGLELVTADNINERGEILGVAVPARCFPDFCGHLYLLIPCAEGDTGNCTDNGARNTAAPASSVPTIDRSTISPQRIPISRDSVATWRAHTAKRYYVADVGAR